MCVHVFVNVRVSGFPPYFKLDQLFIAEYISLDVLGFSGLLVSASHFTREHWATEEQHYILLYMGSWYAYSSSYSSMESALPKEPFHRH